VETQCDLLNGLFNIQDVKDVFITGLLDLVQAHVRVLNHQFPDRTLSETVATAQMDWDGTNKLRLQLKMTRPTAIKVVFRDTGPADDDGMTGHTGSHPAAPSGLRPSSQSV